MAKRKLTLADFEGTNSLNMPSRENTRGIADPAALRALAWGEDYDVDARRNAIAAAMLAQTVAAPRDAAAPGFDQLTAGLGGRTDYRFGGSGDYGMGAGPAPSPGQGGQSFADMLGGKPSDFFTGQPPGRSAINPDRAPQTTRSFAPDDEGEKAPDARTTDQIIESIMQNVPAPTAPVAPTPTSTPEQTPAPTPTAPAPTAPAPSTPTPESVTQSGIPMGARSPSMYGDQPTPGGLPPSGNLYEGVPGFNTFGSVVTPGGRGFPGEHSDVPVDAPLGNPPAGPVVDYGAPTPGNPLGTPTGAPADYGGPLGQGREGAGKGPGGPGRGDFADTGGFPGGAFTGRGGQGREGFGEQDTGDKEGEGGKSAAEIVAEGFANAPATPSATPSFTAPDFSSSAMGRAGLAMAASGFNAGPSFTGGRGGATSGFGSNAFGMPSSGFTGQGMPMGSLVSQGMPAPGGFFGPGFSFTAAPDKQADPSLSDTGDPTGWGDQNAGQTPDVSLGALGAAVGAASMGAGGAPGFGGMGPGGGVGPGGMSTGGTGEIGSVSGGGMGQGGFAGNAASEAGGFGFGGGAALSGESGGPGALGGGMGGGGASGGLGGLGAAGAAGGSGGFGGMGATGAVGGMSTGGTGEIGSVAEGAGGMAGAGMGGGIGLGGIGSGGFDPGGNEGLGGQGGNEGLGGQGGSEGAGNW